MTCRVGTVLAKQPSKAAVMATPYPSPDGFSRPPSLALSRVASYGGASRPRRGRFVWTTFNVVGAGATVAAPVAAVSLWLLLTNPVLAGEVAERGSLFPIVRTLVFAVGKALATVLAYL